MKRCLCILMILVFLPALSYGDSFDLSNYSYDELVSLRNQINLAMWNSEKWQEVIVPRGVWEIGVDIPEGHWSITPYDGLGPDAIVYANATKDQGHDVVLNVGEFIIDYVCSPTAQFYSGEYKISTDFIMEAGHFVRLDCTMIFSPYSGKPDFGFK